MVILTWKSLHGLRNASGNLCFQHMKSSFRIDWRKVENCSEDTTFSLLKRRGTLLHWCYGGALVSMELATCTSGKAPSMMQGFRATLPSVQMTSLSGKAWLCGKSPGKMTVKELEFQMSSNLSLQLPGVHRLLLKEEGMLHSGKHGPVPTFLRHVAAIKFNPS